MKNFAKRHKVLLVLLSVTAVLFISLFIPLRIPGKSSDYTTAGSDIVFRYEIFGCGSLIRKIERGGEAVYQKANLPMPEGGVYEIQFTPDSDEPKIHTDSAEFHTGGLASKYSYYMTIDVVGIEQGSPDCCEPKPAYNEIVPLVKVVKWEPTSFAYDMSFSPRHFFTMLLLYPLVFIDVIGILISIGCWAKNKIGKQD